MQWSRLTQGLLPEPGENYKDWILCEDIFSGQPKYAGRRFELQCCGQDTPSGYTGIIDPINCRRQSVQWSPRRHHASVTLSVDESNDGPIQYLYVMGGRAREMVDYQEEKSVGGIIDPRVKDVPVPGHIFSTQREASVLKSDVWRSVDGVLWELINPGCEASQKSVIPQGNARDGKSGKKGKKCRTADDCYGNERCTGEEGDPQFKWSEDGVTWGTCYCSMWSPREQHAAVSYGGYIYVAGGYVSQLYSKRSNCGAYACGDTEGSTYRRYMEDIWRWDGTKLGLGWISLEIEFGFGGGRGGLSLLAFPDSSGLEYLWIIGGRGVPQGGDQMGNPGDVVEMKNDIWRARISSTGISEFEQVTSPAIPWSGRTGHTAVLEHRTPANGRQRRLYVIGGDTGADEFSDETWVWALDDPNEIWRKDFNPEAMYHIGAGTDLKYYNNSPSTHYVARNLDLPYMARFWLPLKTGVGGTAPERRDYIYGSRLEQLNALGIHTIRDLAEDADVYTILKLRGYDYPNVPADQLMDFYDICDVRALAQAIINKCKIDQNKGFYDGERQHPQYILPRFGGAPPFITGPKNGDGTGNWHGRDYKELAPRETYDELVSTWDGCQYLNLPPLAPTAFNNRPNVEGIGWVEQAPGIKDPTPLLNELQCRYTPKRRAYHTSLMFEERLYLFGGKSTEHLFNANTWYRDSRFPTVYMATAPRSYTTDNSFIFSADEDGCQFQYRVWDPYNYKVIKDWTPVVRRADVRWLDWRNNGPGNGIYILYVRAIDPAGNIDPKFEGGRNYHRWYYVSPIPWDIIAEGVGSFIGLCLFGYAEYRRRMKKAAMERYAIKRMRRKFKALQKDMEGGEVDWRTLYNESKLKEGRKKAKKKDKADKSKDKRDAEKKKKDKEKENIKKKLKAGKDFKDKKKREAKAAEAKAPKERKPAKGGKKGKIIPVDGEDEEKGDDVSPKKLKDYEKDGSKDPKYKDYEKSKDPANPKFKDYEKDGGKERKTNNKYKDYEQGQAPPPSSDADEMERDGAKQRKTNKRYKDYEEKDGGPGSNDKKDA